MKQFRVMKSYTGKFQKCEVEVIADTKEELLEETNWADDFAKKELDKMVDYVAKYDDKRESGIVPTPAPKTTLASDKQKELIKKYLSKAKEVAARLDLELDLETLTNKDARAIIDGMFAKK